MGRVYSQYAYTQLYRKNKQTDIHKFVPLAKSVKFKSQKRKEVGLFHSFDSWSKY